MPRAVRGREEVERNSTESKHVRALKGGRREEGGVTDNRHNSPHSGYLKSDWDLVNKLVVAALVTRTSSDRSLVNTELLLIVHWHLDRF